MEQTVMSALLTLTPHQFSDLIHSVSSDFRLQNHRRCSLLLSPRRFTHTLHLLSSLSFHQKTMLIARYLLTTLKQLTAFWDTQRTHNLMQKGDSDAVLLLMLLSEVSHYDSESLESTSSTRWIDAIQHYTLNNLFTLSGIGACPGTILCKCIDTATGCWRFLLNSAGDHMEREVGTSAVAIVSFPWVEVDGAVSVECAICKEEMPKGRDVCELPCQHLFHWACLLPWLKKRNTCPCCRFQLPTDDVFGEIERLWGILAKKGRSRTFLEF